MVSAIKLDVALGSKKRQEIIGGIISFKGEGVLKLDLIKRYTNELWNKAVPYYTGLAAFHLLMTLVLTLHILFVDDKRLLNEGYHHILLYILAIQNVLSIIYSLYELILEKWNYLFDFWNLVDSGANLLILTYWVAFFTGEMKDDQCILLAYGCIFVYLRLIGFFRIRASTRYYIQMILFVTIKIRSFLVILMTITLSISFSYKALRQHDDYENYWLLAFRLMQGDFEDEIPEIAAERILFVLGSLILPILALNLLIAIISDAFVDVQENFEQADMIERLELI